VIYLDLDDLLHVARRAISAEVQVRDVGLLESALARPRASAFGEDAYPDLDAKVAALMHSIARSHALVDGNKRLALAAAIALLGVKGRRLTLTNNEVYDLVIDIAVGRLDEVADIAARLAAGSEHKP
jgi:death on curing protein